MIIYLRLTRLCPSFTFNDSLKDSQSLRKRSPLHGRCRFHLQVAFLNIQEYFPCVKSLSDESVEVPFETQTLQVRCEIIHSCVLVGA